MAKEYKIISVIKPFDMKQKIFVYEGSNKITQEEVSLEDFAKIATQLCSQYASYSVTIIGPKDFTHKYGQDILEFGLTKYAMHLEVNYI